MKLRSISRGWNVLFLASLGCRESVAPVEPPAFETVSNVATLEAFADDSLLADLAREEPSIGGLYVDEEGVLTVLVVNVDRAAAAARVARRLVAEGRVRGIAKSFNGKVRHRPARFSLIELAEWRLKVRDKVEELGALWIDLNEARNRIEIGIPRSEQERVVQQLSKYLSSLRIPAASIEVRDGVALIPRSGARNPGPIGPASLNGYADTLVGGLGIGWQGGALAGPCTIGFVAERSVGGTGIVTASHCSPTIWGLDNANGLY